MYFVLNKGFAGNEGARWRISSQGHVGDDALKETSENLIKCAGVVALAERIFACTIVPTFDRNSSQ